MLTLYQLSLHPYPDELLKCLQQYTDEPATAALVTVNKGWLLTSSHLLMSGSFKATRLNVTYLKVLSEKGFDALRDIAVKCRGTVIGVWEDGWEPLYILKGQEERVSILELYERNH